MVDEVIKRLRVLIDLNRDDRLPPLSVLSELLDVPQRALLKAARKMRDMGELDFGTGKGIRITRDSRENPGSTISLPSADRLHKIIRNGISSGKYTVGERLPKRDHFVLDYAVSSHTVTKALKKLAADDLIYRKGKSWIVGRPVKTRIKSPRDLPVIVTIQNNSNTWQSFRNERTGSFVDRFAGEANRFGFRLQPFFVTGTNPANLQPYGNINALNEFIGNLDHLYFGSIIIGDPEKYINFRGLVYSLTLLKRPVAWFDKVHRTPIPSDISPYYYHFHFSESRLATAAIKHLADHGHTKVCYVDIAEAEWSFRRVKLLQEFANEFGIELINFMDVYARYKSKDPDEFLSEFQSRLPHTDDRFRKAATFVASEYGHTVDPNAAFHSSAQTDIARFFQDEPPMDISEYGKLRGARELLVTLYDDRSTAIIFPRDRAARGYFHTLDHMSLRIPNDISVLSFDNQYDSTTFPANSVDIGAELLGYQAFHALSGITPVTRNCRDGSISAVPKVVDRGSVSYID